MGRSVGRGVGRLKGSDRHGDRELDPEAGLHAVGEVTAPDGDLTAVFSMSSFVTQSPIPVPTSSLVVKKGSKMRLSWDSGMPTPLSSTVRTAVASSRVMEIRTREPVAACASRALEIGGDLAEFVRGDGDEDALLKPPVDLNLFHHVAMAEDGEHVFDSVGDEDHLTSGAASDQAESETCDVAEASEFQLGGVEIFVSLNADGAIAASEVEEIGARPIWKLLVVSRLCGFAKRGKLRMEEFRGEGAGEGFDGFALLRCEVGQFGLSSG